MSREVDAPLHELCKLVRAGTVPSSEVKRLVKKYSSKTDPGLLLERVLVSAREAANETHDKHIRANAWVAIAGFSHKDEDVDCALKVLDGIDSDVLKYELVKILVQMGKLNQVHKVAIKIKDAYYRTEALLCLACATRVDQDFARASAAAKGIRNKVHLDEFEADIEHARVYKVNRRSPKTLADEVQKAELIEHLVEALIRLHDFDEAHKVAMTVTSPHLRIRVFAAIATALAEMPA